MHTLLEPPVNTHTLELISEHLVYRLIMGIKIIFKITAKQARITTYMLKESKNNMLPTSKRREIPGVVDEINKSSLENTLLQLKS